MDIGSLDNHRQSEDGVLVYPVFSRRSQGLSMGINLFPDRKECLFDCAYCQIFPFSNESSFSLDVMEESLVKAIKEAQSREIVVKDICFSGNGEPTQSPHFPSALEIAFGLRDKYIPESDLVLITNGTGLLYESIFDLLLKTSLRERGLEIWLKLDAGTPLWYNNINRSHTPYESLVDTIKDFTKKAPVTLQTMICLVNDEAPSPVEAKAWEALVREIAVNSKELKAIQIYGKARSSPGDPLAASLPIEFLEARAESIRNVLTLAEKNIPVRVFN